MHRAEKESRVSVVTFLVIAAICLGAALYGARWMITQNVPLPRIAAQMR